MVHVLVIQSKGAAGLACIQTSPLPQKKSGEETFPDFLGEKGRTATATTNAKSRAFWLRYFTVLCVKMLFAECGELWSG